MSDLVESLRGKIRDINVAAGQQEAANKRIAELERSLAAAHRQIQRLQDAATAVDGMETNSLGQVPPAPNPRQKKPSVCNMTTSTTLPMGFEFAATAASSSVDQRPEMPVANMEGEESAVKADSRRRSMSLEVLSTTNRSVVESGSEAPSASAASSATTPLSSRPSTFVSSEVNYDTFSRKSGSVTERPRHGLHSCTLISLGVCACVRFSLSYLARIR